MSKYNESVREVFGLGKTQGEVGLEIEMEGRGFIRGGVGKFWSFHNDGSLRGEENAEYVLTAPVPRATVPTTLKELFSSLKGAGTRIRKDSPNTSVHVHLNVQEWSVKKVYNLICLWHILEETLTEWCGEDRKGNLFCLRGSDAEVSLMRLASAVRYSRYNTIADQDGLRYTALNYTALGKFGSLEFRCLGGVYDEETVNLWVRILLSLKDYAENFVCPSDLIVEMSRVGHEQFLHDALPNDLWRAVTNKDVKRQMQDGMRLIQGVAYAVNWDRESKKKPEGEKAPGVGFDPNLAREPQPDEQYPNYVGDQNNQEAIRRYIVDRDGHEERRRDRREARRRQGLEPVGFDEDRLRERGRVNLDLEIARQAAQPAEPRIEIDRTYRNPEGELVRVSPHNFQWVEERGWERI